MNKKNKNIVFIGVGALVLYLILKPKNVSSTPVRTIAPIAPGGPTNVQSTLTNVTNLVGGLSTLFGSSTPAPVDTTVPAPVDTTVPTPVDTTNINDIQLV